MAVSTYYLPCLVPYKADDWMDLLKGEGRSYNPMSTFTAPASAPFELRCALKTNPSDESQVGPYCCLKSIGHQAGSSFSCDKRRAQYVQVPSFPSQRLTGKLHDENTRSLQVRSDKAITYVVVTECLAFLRLQIPSLPSSNRRDDDEEHCQHHGPNLGHHLSTAPHLESPLCAFNSIVRAVPRCPGGVEDHLRSHQPQSSWTNASNLTGQDRLIAHS